MSKTKSKTQTQDEFEAELKGEVPTFDGKAITILKLEDKKFLIVKIAVDQKNLVAGEVETIDTAESKPEAVEKFKIAVARNGII